MLQFLNLKVGGRPTRVRAWAFPAAIIVGLEYAVALLIGLRVGFHYSIPFEAYAVIGLTTVGATAAALIVVRLAYYASEKEQNPARRLLAEAPRFTGFAVGSLLVALQISVLTWTKVMLPIAAPFWADPVLARLDHSLFGKEPWVLAHRAFGWASPFLDLAYITWAPVKFATFVIVLVTSESERKARALVTYFVMLAAVALGQYLLSSAGPVFYAQFGFGSRFAALPIEPWVGTTRAYLWHDYLKAGGDIGGGISAMPSLHVAAALWVALIWNGFDRRLGVIGFSYFGLIAIGSVFLGWHYAVDGIVGAGIVLLAWAVAPGIARRFGEGTADALNGGRLLRNNGSDSTI